MIYLLFWYSTLSLLEDVLRCFEEREISEYSCIHINSIYVYTYMYVNINICDHKYIFAHTKFEYLPIPWNADIDIYM
jgi:hypothetical protein